jgi:hypothetical protein
MPSWSTPSPCIATDDTGPATSPSPPDRTYSDTHQRRARRSPPGPMPRQVDRPKLPPPLRSTPTNTPRTRSPTFSTAFSTTPALVGHGENRRRRHNRRVLGTDRAHFRNALLGHTWLGHGHGSRCS